MIYNEIKAERWRQHEKHGEQNIPSWHPDANKDPMMQRTILRLMPEEIIKARVDAEEKSDTKNWSSIALEEFIEAVNAPSDYERRSELVQLAAVIVQWIECLDRNNMCVVPEIAKFDDNTPMPFGDHKGVPMGNVPPSYLIWLLEEGSLSSGPLKDYIEDNLPQLKAGF